MPSPRSVLLTRGLYAATAVLVVVGLALQLVPSTRRLEASSTNLSTPLTPSGKTTPPDSALFESAEPAATAPPNAKSSAAIPLPGEFQAVIISNIFAPERAPPRARYRPRGAGEVEGASPATASRSSPALRLFGVTLRANGAVALIDADPAVPGAEIYRVGDAIAGGRLVEIGPASVVIERSTGRQVIRLEAERPVRGRSRGVRGDSVSAPRDSVRDEQ
ncbi:MAG: hypothetical protein M3365_07130 [Gemmatimonadota bacterium]|nr:hypothetical protein [Gemmatimonadota bacterium]